MKDRNMLLGKKVTAYLDGGWEVAGVVENITEKFVMIQNEQGSFLIFKAKISGILFGSNRKKDYDSRNFKYSTMSSEDREGDDPVSSRSVNFPENEINYRNTGMHIPSDMLSKDFQDSEENRESDFSIFFGGKANEDDDIKK
tara:strand:+ start:3716 stop:4141 length:426 start_codon:yes stop_codon:yes gene_type:complete